MISRSTGISLSESLTCGLRFDERVPRPRLGVPRVAVTAPVSSTDLPPAGGSRIHIIPKSLRPFVTDTVAGRPKGDASPRHAGRCSTLSGYKSVLSGVVDLLDDARRYSARAVNAAMTETYWEIGRRIVEWEQVG